MNAPGRNGELNQITERVIGCVYQVSHILGPGFLEKVYENALALELREHGFDVEQQRRIKVFYRDVVVGDFVADLLVASAVVVEIKATKAIEDAHYAQCLNYLRATGLKVCLLVNFGHSRAGVKRIVLNYQPQEDRDCRPRSAAEVRGWLQTKTERQ